MNHISAHYVVETKRRESGRSMLRLEDLGGCMTELRIEIGDETISIPMTENTLAEYIALLQARMDEINAVLKPELRVAATA